MGSESKEAGSASRKRKQEKKEETKILEKNGATNRKGFSVAVVVLGDIGRSPRMQYHAMSLAGVCDRVDLVGYQGTDPHERLVNNRRIHIHKMTPFPALPRYLFLFYAILKILWQTFQLCWLLWTIPKPAYILVQTPPAIPTLAIVRIMAWMRSSRLIIDWHNLGFTLMMLTMHKQESHPIISFAKWFELFCGNKAYAHLTVTKALKEKMKNEWKARGRIVTHYDRPAEIFKPFEEEEKVAFLQVLAAKHPPLKPLLNNRGSPSRAVLIVSSTSWTEDEDFGILFNAVAKYDKEAATQSLPPLVLVITGKGPLRAYYETKIAIMGLKRVSILTMWLAAEDYPKVLASADIGISLHTSSSKLDLPMKVVDMLGAGLPVCALTYPTLHELLPADNSRGRHFADEDELLCLLVSLLSDFQQPTSELSRIRQSIRHFLVQHSWNSAWTEKVAPLFV